MKPQLTAGQVVVRTCGAIAFAALVLMLTGCAGLSVNFDAVITYRSDVPAGERKP